MEEVVIDQQVIPSRGTKLVCTRCGREDFHVLLLRRRRGLIEGLCKQQDGTGCYPNSSRGNCKHVDPNKIACTQLAEWEIVDRHTYLTLTETCTDHLGITMTANGAEVFPLED